MELDWSNIGQYTADPTAYLFVDRVNIDGNEARGVKMVSSQDWYFKMHFPGNPIMPGVFVMEAVMQTGVFIVTTKNAADETLMMFHSCRNMRMYGEVRPGDLLETHAVLRSFRGGVASYTGEASVREKTVCRMEFILIAPGELSRATPPGNAQGEMGKGRC